MIVNGATYTPPLCLPGSHQSALADPSSARHLNLSYSSGPMFVTVERDSAVLKALYVLCRPEPEWRNVVEHLGAEGRDAVFHPGRDLGKDLARYESVALESAECLC